MHKRGKLPGFTQPPASPQEVCHENETKKQRKNEVSRKMLLMEGNTI